RLGATVRIAGVGRGPGGRSSGTTGLTESIGMAKPMPAFVPEGERMAVVTPITRPAESSNGPPELPGLMAASVWITLVISRPPLVGRRRLSALMIPVVKV